MSVVHTAPVGGKWPIEFRVLANIRAALVGIKQADGYIHDVEHPDAVSMRTNDYVRATLGDFAYDPMLVLWIPDERTDPLNEPQSQMLDVLPVTIFAGATYDLMDPESEAWVATSLMADIEKAIAQDPTRGGLVGHHHLTAERTHSPFAGTNRLMVRFPTECRLHRPYGEPTC